MADCRQAKPKLAILALMINILKVETNREIHYSRNILIRCSELDVIE